MQWKIWCLIKLYFIILPYFLIAQPDLIPFCQQNRWGYCDKNQKTIIPCYYEETTPFVNELGKVKQNGKWGLIDKKGKIFLPCEYDIVYGASKNHAIVVCVGGDKAGYGGKWGFAPIYEGGEIILEYDLIRESGIEDLLAVQKNGKWGCINLRGKIIIPIQYDIENFQENTDNQVFMPSLTENFKPNYYPKLRFTNGFTKLNLNGKWGVLNQYGNPIIPFEYDDLGEISEGLIPALRAGKWGFIDLENKIKIPFQYLSVAQFREGLVVVNAGESLDNILNPIWQVIDNQGNMKFKIPQDYKLLDLKFQNGFLRVRAKEREFFLDKKGKKLGDFEKAQNFGKELAMVVKNGRTGLINTKGKIKIPFLYDITQLDEPIGKKMADLIQVRLNNKWGILNTKNRQVLDFQYDEILFPAYQDYYEQPDEALFAVLKAGKWGFVNAKNRNVIVCKYDKVAPFENDLAKVRFQGKLGYIDKKGKEYWE